MCEVVDSSEDIHLKINEISKAKIGDCISFGKYYQKKGIAVKDEIQWIVLDMKDNKVLVISKCSLDCKPYNTPLKKITWEKCSLRNWLNTNFITEAFNTDERNCICETMVTADKNPGCRTNPGKDTKDKVFILSCPEVKKYFQTKDIRKCKPTEYAKNNGNGCCWWLRSPGRNQYTADYVDYYGDIPGCGNSVDRDEHAVRPAMWINLEA